MGILKDWLTRALAVALDENEPTLSLEIPQRCAPTLDRCEQIAVEALAAEERLVEKADRANRLMEMLGLPTQTPSDQPVQKVKEQQAGQTTAEVAPRLPGRIGQRKPKRDPVRK